jgi:hypothetical protein
MQQQCVAIVRAVIDGELGQLHGSPPSRGLEARGSEHTYGEDQDQEGGNHDRWNKPRWISHVLCRILPQRRSATLVTAPGEGLAIGFVASRVSICFAVS